MALNGLFSPATGLVLGGMNLLQRRHGSRQRADRSQHILDDASDVEETDASRQKGRDGHLVGRIQHDRCKSTQHQSFSRQA